MENFRCTDAQLQPGEACSQHEMPSRALSCQHLCTEHCPPTPILLLHPSRRWWPHRTAQHRPVSELRTMVATVTSQASTEVSGIHQLLLCPHPTGNSLPLYSSRHRRVPQGLAPSGSYGWSADVATAGGQGQIKARQDCGLQGTCTVSLPQWCRSESRHSIFWKPTSPNPGGPDTYSRP